MAPVIARSLGRAHGPTAPNDIQQLIAVTYAAGDASLYGRAPLPFTLGAIAPTLAPHFNRVS
jgi:hypothetical protein